MISLPLPQVLVLTRLQKLLKHVLITGLIMLLAFLLFLGILARHFWHVFLLLLLLLFGIFLVPVPIVLHELYHVVD